jgi:hypothetical protein
MAEKRPWEQASTPGWEQPPEDVLDEDEDESGFPLRTWPQRGTEQ